MIRFTILAFLALLLIGGCGTTTVDSALAATDPVNLENAPEASSLGDIRIVFLGVKGVNIVLVNKNNQKYLQIPQQNQGKKRSELSGTDFVYTDREVFPISFSNTVKIVENVVMAQLLALAEQMNFYTHATSSSLEEVAQSRPSRDSILIEKDGRWHLLVRLSLEERQSPGGAKVAYARTYQAMKMNILRAPGEPIVAVASNINSSRFMNQSIHNMHRSNKQIRNKYGQ